MIEFGLGVIAGIGFGVAIERGVPLPPGPHGWRYYFTLGTLATCGAVIWASAT